MPYICTRGGEKLTAAQAILKGLAGNGGLYVPCTLPRAADDMLPFAADMPYAQRVARVLSYFLDDFSDDSWQLYQRSPEGNSIPNYGMIL